MLNTSSAVTKDISEPSNATFFKVEYSKTGRFAVNTIKQNFDKAPHFGESCLATLPSVSDLLSSCTLEVTLTKKDNRYPAALASYFPVERLCKRAEITAGEQHLETLDSDYFRLYDTWHRNSDQREQYKRLANFDAATLGSKGEYTETLYLPLVFGFTHDAALGLPVGMLTDAIRLHIDFATAQEVGVCDKALSACIHCDFVTVDESQAWIRKTPPHVYLPHVQIFHKKLLTPPRQDSVTSHAIPLPFKGPVRNLTWVLKESQPLAPGQSDHGRYVGDPHGTCLALQASPSNPSGLGLWQTISEKLAPVYDAGLSLNNKTYVVYEKGEYFNKVLPLQKLKTSCTPGHYFYTWALHPHDLNPGGYIDLSPTSKLWLHLRLKQSSPKPLSDSVFCSPGGVAKDIEGLTGLHVYAEGFRLMTVQDGSLHFPWEYGPASGASQ